MVIWILELANEKLRTSFALSALFVVCGLQDDLLVMVLLILMTKEMPRMLFVNLMVRMVGE